MSFLRKAAMPFAKRFVAGETVDSAVSYAETVNQQNLHPLIDLLGEHVEDREQVEQARQEYLELLDRLEEDGTGGALSIKPSHLGMDIEYEYCRETVDDLVEHAADMDRFVWVDMESSAYTDDTIRLYRDLQESYTDVGLCLQAELKRTRDDLQDLTADGGVIRLVKGAYDEADTVAFQDRSAVTEHYRELLRHLFQQDTYFAVATHDEELIQDALAFQEEYGRANDEFEFQFLMGVRPDRFQELADNGHTVSEYVPYGPEWLSYYWRRVRERKENLRFAARAFIGR